MRATAQPLRSEPLPQGRRQTKGCADDDIIAGCQRGESWAMEHLYRRYKRRVFAVVARIVGHGDAEEVSQEAFIRIFRGIGKFRGDSALSTWVYRLSVNAALTHAKRHPKRNHSDQWLATLPADEKPRRDPALAARLELALQELPPGYRAVLVLHDIEGKNHEECAAILGCRVGTSKSQLHKARAKMRDLLKDDLASLREAS